MQGEETKILRSIGYSMVNSSFCDSALASAKLTVEELAVIPMELLSAMCFDN